MRQLESARRSALLRCPKSANNGPERDGNFFDGCEATLLRTGLLGQEQTWLPISSGRFWLLMLRRRSELRPPHGSLCRSFQPARGRRISLLHNDLESDNQDSCL